MKSKQEGGKTGRYKRRVERRVQRRNEIGIIYKNEMIK